MERFKLSLAVRERISLIVVFAVLLFLASGLINLQVFRHSELADQSENNRIRMVPIVPQRGRIYDREGRIIVDNRPSYTVSVVPAEEVPGVTVANLARLINLDTLVVRKRIQRNTVSRYRPAPVKKDIAFEVIAVLEEQSCRFPGVSYQMERVRKYVEGLRAESFTGYVGEASREELLKGRPEELRLGSMIGKKGLERQYDHVLRGREGFVYHEVRASGQLLGPYEGKRWVDAIPGADITLTIDIDLQRACVKALDTFCCGAVVALDPQTGEVLAMTSYPGYEANIFSSVIPDSTWEAIRNDPNDPLVNRCLSGMYPPGSIIKLLTLGAGLEDGIITEKSTLQPCYGGFQFGNRYFRCWNPAGHGALTAAHAIEQSCDVYFYQLGLKLGVDLLSQYLAKSGFGVTTGIDLPNEAAGLNPNSDYYNERYGKGKWTRGLVLNLAIGQGEILCTPLQLAQFYCGLACDGVVYQPHIVKSTFQPDGKEMTVRPTVAFTLPFSSSTLDVLKEGIRLVVEGEKGTARSLRNKNYSLGGKTGTAQNPHGENHSLFVGVAPLEKPEIVVCAVIENAGHGSDVAAPVVKRVIDVFMQKKTAGERVTALSEVESP